MTLYTTLLVIAIATHSINCASDEEATTEPRVATKVYDFSGMRLADSPRAVTGPATDKRRIRDAFEAVRPQLLACAAANPAVGTLGVVIEFSATGVDSIRFDGELADRATLTSCFTGALAGMSTPVTDDGLWQVHYPIVIGR